MAYKIVKTEQVEDTINTTVVFDGKEEEIVVSHFRPNSVEEVMTGIENRKLSDKAKESAIEKCAEIIKQITV